jgi:hypothetical protein
MLGPPKARHVDRPVLASLETLVPPEHFYRHLEARLDLSFVRALAQDRYAATGRPSIDPVVGIVTLTEKKLKHVHGRLAPPDQTSQGKPPKRDLCAPQMRR